MRTLATAALALTLALAAAEGCSKSNPLVSAGGACDVATDCAPGLVCIPVESGGRVCSSDLTSVAGNTPPPPERADATADASESDAAPPPEEDATVPPPDASEPDAEPIVEAGTD